MSIKERLSTTTQRLRASTSSKLESSRELVYRKTSNIGPNGFAMILGFAIALAGFVIWNLVMLQPVTFDSPSWAPWLHSATKITLIVMYTPVAFVVIYSSTLFFRSVSYRLDNIDEQQFENVRVKPHRITRKIAETNTKNALRVRRRLNDVSTSGGARLLVEDLDEIVFDTARHPLPAIFGDHLPRMLLLRRRWFKRLGPLLNTILTSLVIIMVLAGIGWLTWTTGWFAFYTGIVTSFLCAIMTLAFWEHSRIRQVLTRHKLGTIEWRLFFGGKRPTFVLVENLTESAPELKGLGQALKSKGWGDIVVRTTEHNEILRSLTNIPDAEFHHECIESVRQRTLEP